MSHEDEQEVVTIDTTDEQDIDIELEDTVEAKTYTEEQFKTVWARAKAAEDKLKTYKPETKQVKKVDDDIRQTVSELKLAEQKRQFGYENGLSPEEADHIFRINPNPSKETLDDPFVKGGLEAIRAKKKLESNTPALNSRSPKFQVPSKKDMTAEDKQKAFEEFMASKKR
jgi:hypothetical protein